MGSARKDLCPTVPGKKVLNAMWSFHFDRWSRVRSMIELKLFMFKIKMTNMILMRKIADIGDIVLQVKTGSLWIAIRIHPQPSLHCHRYHLRFKHWRLNYCRWDSHASFIADKQEVIQKPSTLTLGSRDQVEECEKGNKEISTISEWPLKNHNNFWPGLASRMNLFSS